MQRQATTFEMRAKRNGYVQGVTENGGQILKYQDTTQCRKRQATTRKHNKLRKVICSDTDCNLPSGGDTLRFFMHFYLRMSKFICTFAPVLKIRTYEKQIFLSLAIGCFGLM